MSDPLLVPLVFLIVVAYLIFRRRNQATSIDTVSVATASTNPAELDHYSVMYKGGLPQHPKARSSPLTFKIYPDRFEIHPTFGADWFTPISIPLSEVADIQLLRRQAGLLETGIAGLDSVQLNTASIVELSFVNDKRIELKTRWQMLSGLSAQGQAAKALEMLDLIRSNGLMQSFRGRSSLNVETDGIPDQIHKLATLRDKGILTESEFLAKKSQLLDRM